MVEPSASSSRFLGHRLAVVALTGLAATYGLYAVYSSFAKRPSPVALHRSNAVHRSRSDRPRSFIEQLGYSHLRPLGALSVTVGETTHVYDLGSELPSTDYLQQLFGGSGSDAQRLQDEIVEAALKGILSLCLYAGHEPVPRSALAAVGLEQLRNAMANRSPFVIQAQSRHIAAALGWPAVSEDIVEGIVAEFLTDFLTPSEADASETDEGLDAENEVRSDGVRGLLYYSAENYAREKAYEHRGVNCDQCGATPIQGVRWHCLNCPSYDLCSMCEHFGREHPRTHVFAKIKVPLPVLSRPGVPQEVWYPGDPRANSSELKGTSKKLLCTEYGFEETQIDAFFDQFACIAKTVLPNDPCQIGLAIDKPTFYIALTSAHWEDRLATDFLYERMFDFYDTNKDNLIGFEEFVRGLAYLRGPKRFDTLERALRGFDPQRKGSVTRADFKKLLDAKFRIHRRIISEAIRDPERDQTQAAVDIHTSSQPISSVFQDEDAPLGERRSPSGKHPDRLGDLQPDPDAKTILGNKDPWPDHGPPDERANEIWDTTALRQLIDQAYHELLDQIFKARELEDYSAIATYNKRNKWRNLIHEAVFDVEDLDRVVAAARRAARNDPSFAAGSEIPFPDGREIPETSPRGTEGTAPHFQAEIVPTDAASLAQREAEIRRRSLDGLLSASGYEAMDGVPPPPPPLTPPPPQQPPDPTLPQHRPDHIEMTDPTESADAVDEPPPTPPHHPPSPQPRPSSPPPSHEELLHMAHLDGVYEECHRRGGAGRVDLNELEAMAKADETREIEGLIKGWLEWASF